MIQGEFHVQYKGPISLAADKYLYIYLSKYSEPNKD